ncbi:putative uncharacterized protein DDB_G0282133 [Zerene cesonia]|uniref:putative uncharacterized protein DDB_G0282133 n=1 Tax=Zerene cesonia TaxID=33412 RepID=UPI0018E526C2|nr:putative uncharacterized protein DDB_G0282133 [Zerene cesonia]
MYYFRFVFVLLLFEPQTIFSHAIAKPEDFAKYFVGSDENGSAAPKEDENQIPALKKSNHLSQNLIYTNNPQRDVNPPKETIYENTEPKDNSFKEKALDMFNEIPSVNGQGGTYGMDLTGDHGTVWNDLNQTPVGIESNQEPNSIPIESNENKIDKNNQGNNWSGSNEVSQPASNEKIIITPVTDEGVAIPPAPKIVEPRLDEEENVPSNSDDNNVIVQQPVIIEPTVLDNAIKNSNEDVSNNVGVPSGNTYKLPVSETNNGDSNHIIYEYPKEGDESSNRPIPEITKEVTQRPVVVVVDKIPEIKNSDENNSVEGIPSHQDNDYPKQVIIESKPEPNHFIIENPNTPEYNSNENAINTKPSSKELKDSFNNLLKQIKPLKPFKPQAVIKPKSENEDRVANYVKPIPGSNENVIIVPVQPERHQNNNKYVYRPREEIHPNVYNRPARNPTYDNKPTYIVVPHYTREKKSKPVQKYRERNNKPNMWKDLNPPQNTFVNVGEDNNSKNKNKPTNEGHYVIPKPTKPHTTQHDYDNSANEVETSPSAETSQSNEEPSASNEEPTSSNEKPTSSNRRPSSSNERPYQSNEEYKKPSREESKENRENSKPEKPQSTEHEHRHPKPSEKPKQNNNEPIKKENPESQDKHHPQNKPKENKPKDFTKEDLDNLLNKRLKDMVKQEVANQLKNASARHQNPASDDNQSNTSNRHPKDENNNTERPSRNSAANNDANKNNEKPSTNSANKNNGKPSSNSTPKKNTDRKDDNGPTAEKANKPKAINNNVNKNSNPKHNKPTSNSKPKNASKKSAKAHSKNNQENEKPSSDSNAPSYNNNTSVDVNADTVYGNTVAHDHITNVFVFFNGNGTKGNQGSGDNKPSKENSNTDRNKKADNSKEKQPTDTSSEKSDKQDSDSTEKVNKPKSLPAEEKKNHKRDSSSDENSDEGSKKPNKESKSPQKGKSTTDNNSSDENSAEANEQPTQNSKPDSKSNPADKSEPIEKKKDEVDASKESSSEANKETIKKPKPEKKADIKEKPRSEKKKDKVNQVSRQMPNLKLTRKNL